MLRRCIKGSRSYALINAIAIPMRCSKKNLMHAVTRSESTRMKSIGRVFSRTHENAVKIGLARISAQSDEMLSFSVNSRGAIYAFLETLIAMSLISLAGIQAGDDCLNCQEKYCDHLLSGSSNTPEKAIQVYV
jgi:hypothetical protein